MNTDYGANFTAAQRATIDQMHAGLGDVTVSSNLNSLSVEDQLIVVEGYAQVFRISASQAAGYEARMIDLMSMGQSLERVPPSKSGAQREPAAAAADRHGQHRPRAFKLEVTNSGGTNLEPILHLIIQVTAAIEALGIMDESLRVTFAMSHLKERAVE